ncbi:MAG: hypothetical protein JXM79_07930 [Sedimentisphaerales bacterium]|nr:hypothetical protein [Sedimentisphaerales bacterium]
MLLNKSRWWGKPHPTFLAITLIIFVYMDGPASGKTLIEWDFSKGLHGWTANNKVEALSFSSEGLQVKCTGEDPWIEGPAVDLSGEPMTRVKVRMKSNADASAELFYGQVFRAGDSVRFTVRNDGQWHDYSLVIRDTLGPGTRFRLDPCVGPGDVTISSIAVETIRQIALPSMKKPGKPDKALGSEVTIQSGNLKFEHYGNRWGNFALTVNGMEMASGHDSELIGVLFDGQPEWLNLENAEVTFKKPSGNNRFVSKAIIKDSQGARWQIRKITRPSKHPGTLIVTTILNVNRDRDIVHIPWLTIFPGLGTFGERKDQGLFAGLEYLCDEPSSSKADIDTPDYIRRVPDPIKITFPLMAIAHSGHYIGVIWEPSEMIAATFDSPDTIYNSGAHVMALSGPGIGERRFENDLVAHSPVRLEADKPLRVTIQIIGGKGRTIIPAIKQYVALKGLPAVPEFEGGFDKAVDLLSHGWLDSQINEDGLIRHAVWGKNFPAGPAADAAMYMDWLAIHTDNENFRKRLINGKDRVLTKIPPDQPFSSGVSHVRFPAAPLIFGRSAEFVQQRYNAALHLLDNFNDDGIKYYKPGKTDYSRTHFAKHANGLSGSDMVTILEGVVLTGNEKLANKALQLLDKQTSLYADTVPRGAQTWEVPLHTPDILASAHMVKAYTLGYMISGKEKYLEQARYWAWTGVPFVYIHPPTPGRVGSYATIAVLGATNWKAPLWLGRPVQWCGLVYASALHSLAQYDSNGPWEQIAKGVTATGLQMSWPPIDRERQGLLPDFFDLIAQVSAGPAINPGTVQAHLPELYGKGKLYDVKMLPQRGWFVHAPCLISNIREDEDVVSLTVDGWSDKQYHVLISGIEREPKEVHIRKVAVHSDEIQYHPEHKLLIITLKGKSDIQIR